MIFVKSEFKLKDGVKSIWLILRMLLNVLTVALMPLLGQLIQTLPLSVTFLLLIFPFKVG